LRLSELTEDTMHIETIRPDPDPEITGLTADSRGVAPGYLFAALPGAKADGRRFIADALARGAAAILAPPGTDLPAGANDNPVPLILADDPRRRLALLAARFFGAQPRVAAAVTGTNGKTSVAWFTRQVWRALGHEAASMGTLGVTGPGVDALLGDDAKPGLTTADPVAIHRNLAMLAQAGIDHLVMEASSHGLEQSRLDGVRLAAGAFTNLTRDHLDYHGTMDAYRAAKLRLFDSVLPEGAGAVLNADSDEFPMFSAVARARGLKLVSYGRAAEQLRIAAIVPDGDGQRISLVAFGREQEIRVPLAGSFQARNALCAAGLAIACGDAPEAALAALTTLRGAPGRLERVARRDNGAAIYVDYAHTPDALATALGALRPHTSGRLIVVFGCGGDRDAGKRPQMGAIARDLADQVIVTDDNPRSEAPAAIRADIMAACADADEIGDRAEAIHEGARRLQPGDVLLLAGKGHESGQIFGDRTIPFEDAAVARAAVAALEGRGT
jgi:UDP-N-acetylmuramoyl-L-alanyl-D-glutamate--2,6-diaminopimelate ligase